MFLEGVRKETAWNWRHLSEDEEDSPAQPGQPCTGARYGIAGQKDIPLQEQLKEDPYVQLAIFLMDELALPD